MNERIINLLWLCLDANEKGMNITFNNSAGIVIIMDLTNQDHITSFIIQVKGKFEDEEMTAAEEYLKEVIANAHT